MVMVRNALTHELDVVRLYEILRLRQTVFVVDQQCPYPDIDGRDLEPATRQFWCGATRVESTLRLLREPNGTGRIGRVATAADSRHRGLAAALVTAAINAAGAVDIAIDAQSYLHGWYTRFGFVRSGDEFIEDGIPHIPMMRSARQD